MPNCSRLKPRPGASPLKRGVNSPAGLPARGRAASSLAPPPWRASSLFTDKCYIQVNPSRLAALRNGYDLLTMPLELRDKVPTSNFFQRGGYERNPIARRTGTVAALIKTIETKMDNASQAQGARELAEAF